MESAIKRIYTMPIEFQTLVIPGANPSNYVSVTTYDIAGQGKTLDEACKSALSIVSAHLYHYVQHQVESLPMPDCRLKTVDDVVKHFWKGITKYMLRTQKSEDGKEIIIQHKQDISEAKIRYIKRVLQPPDKYLPLLTMDAYVFELRKDIIRLHVH